MAGEVKQLLQLMETASSSETPGGTGCSEHTQNTWGTQTRRPDSVLHIRKLRRVEAKKRLPKVTHGESVADLGRSGFNLWVGKIPWRRERLPTPVFWPGDFHGLYNPWGRKELDTTERLSLLLCQAL